MINQGVSFGIILPGVELVSVVVLVGVFWWWRRSREWGLLLIFVGGVLNLVERLVGGGVRDYWRIPFTQIYNNINDWLIFVGVIVVLWKTWTKK